MTKRFQLIGEENQLRDLSPEVFATRAADHLIEINAIHPFREGNGRTQRLFLEVLASQAGHTIRSKDIYPKPWHAASIEGFAGNNQPMTALIQAAIQSHVHRQGQDPEHESGNGLER